MNRTQLNVVYFILFFILLRFLIEIVPKLSFLTSTTSPPTSITLFPRPDAYYCDDPKYHNVIWCKIKPPEKSLFRFPQPPADLEKWKLMQNYAIDGDQILLKQILKYFPTEHNFLDGDTLFRSYHHVGDYYLDDNYHFGILNYDNDSTAAKRASRQEKIDQFHKNLQDMLENNKDRRKYDWEIKHKLTRSQVVPDTLPFYHLDRVPILHIGYFVFPKPGDGIPYFSGPMKGEVSIDRRNLLQLWRKSVENIKFPWIGFHSANENWGLLSTYFPNRTTNWGSCCSTSITSLDHFIYELLDHPKTILFLTNQHSNITHPKLITLPRGIPVSFTNTDRIRRLLFDTMRNLSFSKKDNLLFTSSSNWGYRPTMMKCIQHNFDQEKHPLLLNNYGHQLKGRLTPAQYYQVLGKSYFTLALPGLGYDTFRLWETLQVGSIPIIEKGVGFDKSLWKLPALLVEDFNEVTPTLLYTAYLEAIYHAEDFEFERLQQSFWIDFIYNVSKAKTSQKIFEKFPREAEDYGFTRPFTRFTCHQTNSCGRGTKRIPKSFC